MFCCPIKLLKTLKKKKSEFVDTMQELNNETTLHFEYIVEIKQQKV